MTHKISAISAYALIAWITFGHAWANLDDGRFVDTKIIGATGCAIAWPLYLSAQIWEVIG